MKWIKNFLWQPKLSSKTKLFVIAFLVLWIVLAISFGLEARRYWELRPVQGLVITTVVYGIICWIMKSFKK